MFSSTQASRYICGNNLFSGLQNLGEGGRQCVFPELSLDLVSNQNSVLCHLFPTHLSWPLLVLVLREGDTKVIMLWGLEFCPSCCNTVTNGNTRLLWISFSLPFIMPAAPLPSCLPLTSPWVSFPHITSVSPCSSLMSSLYWEMRLRKEQSGSGEHHRADAGLWMIWQSLQNSKQVNCWMFINKRQDIPFPSKHFCL